MKAPAPALGIQKIDDEKDLAPALVIQKFDDEKDLELLLDAFGSVLSLKDIAAAYCQAQRDVYVASEILCNYQGSTSSASNYTSKDELESDSASSGYPEDKWFDKSILQERDLVESKQKKYTASAGSVSGVIGRECARFRSSRNESCEPIKPLKLNSEEFPASLIWNDEAQRNITAVDSVHKDMEDFLFKMLGEGFQLDRKVIQQVLGVCGYNAGKSVEELLHISASNSGKIDEVSSIPSQNPLQQSPERYSDMQAFPGLEESKSMNSYRSDKEKTKSGNGSSKRNKDQNGLQQQVLQALFTVPDRFEEPPRKVLPPKPFTGSRGSIKVVTEPLRLPVTERRTPVATLTGDNEEDDGSYQLLRNAVKEYWGIMTQYYKAAVDAFEGGDHIRANKLLEEGHFFQNKAREADEESAQKFLATKKNDMSLDLLEHDPKEAIRLLKVHFSTLSGIPEYPCLKLIIGTGSMEKIERARKRLVTKFLEKESITWTEEDDGRILVIRFDQIDPKKLSFYQKRDE